MAFMAGPKSAYGLNSSAIMGLSDLLSPNVRKAQHKQVVNGRTLHVRLAQATPTTPLFHIDPHGVSH